jgi:putative addiction module component (TIGR02574 family)
MKPMDLPGAVVAALETFRMALSERFADRLAGVRLFGSYARDQARPDSDVDVLVVVTGLTRRERQEVLDLAWDAYAETLVHVSPLALSETEWEMLRSREYLIAQDIEREGIPLQAGSYHAALAVRRKGLRAETPEGETAGMRNVEFDFSKLSVAERIQLAEDLWDSIPESADIPLTDAQKAELDRRLEDLDQHPEAGEPWEVVRARLYGRLKRGE